MTTDDEPAIYLVNDHDGRTLSVHLTAEGAQTAREFIAAADHIEETTLHR
jgi:hypothetical protein